MSKKILYLSYFFEPDIGAGSFRNSALAKELARQLGDNGSIDLMTTLPNRYVFNKHVVDEFEKNDNLSIHRINVDQHSNSFIYQIKSFLQYRSRLNDFCKDKKYDLVFASSSKFFTAYVAYRIAKKQNVKLYIDLRDLFSENLKELLPTLGIGKILSFIIRNFFEKPCLNYATHLNLNSEGFISEFSYRKNSNTTYFPNGIDDFFIGHRQYVDIKDSPKVICYAGNIGEGQGLEKIIPEAAKRLGANFLFQIIGSGSSVDKLRNELDRLSVNNVKIISPVARKDLLQYYINSHYLFLHLNNYKSFEKVIPSKVFEYGAFNMPILAGVAGFPARFIKTELKSNVFVFNPCDVDSLVELLLTSTYYLKERTEFVSKFRRENITNNLAKSVLQYL
ncbi:MAG: glycosyltransferase family 4 protein [Saprospiraceae bacterium]